MGRRGHKTPFSGKAKKQQLKARRSRRRNERAADVESSRAPTTTKTLHSIDVAAPLTAEELARCVGDASDARALSTVHLKESARAVKRRITRGQERFGQKEAPVVAAAAALVTAASVACAAAAQVSLLLLRLTARFAVPRAGCAALRSLVGTGILPPRSPLARFFTRPAGWSAAMSRFDLDASERAACTRFLQSIYTTVPRARVAPFEHNLEVWRQVWRALERATTAIVVVADVRCPLLHLPVALTEELVQLQQSRALRVVIVLTKCDLVPAGTFERWRDCLGGASAESADSADSASAGGMLGALAPIVVRFDAPHATFVGDHVKLGPRRKLLKQRRGAVARGEWCPSVAPLLEACGIDVGSLGTDSAGAAPSSPRDPADTVDTVDIDVLPTITLLGQPSVGKSSVLNALMAAKVASVSLTAGHTKILQTHIVRRHAHSTPLAVVCDSPGLVFPRAAAEAPRALLEIAGSLMTAQVREPYSAIRLLVERFDLDLPRLYGLPATPTDAYDDAAEYGASSGRIATTCVLSGSAYTPFVVCEELAAKRQWRVARSGRADAHRAGLQIIKDAASGVIPWCC